MSCARISKITIRMPRLRPLKRRENGVLSWNANLRQCVRDKSFLQLSSVKIVIQVYVDNGVILGDPAGRPYTSTSKSPIEYRLQSNTFFPFLVHINLSPHFF